MKEIIFLGNKKVGKGQPTFIVAEAGINHNGDIDVAKEMIIAAAKCGADAIKFQTYQTEKRVNRNSPIYNVLKTCELTKKDHEELFNTAKENGILFFSTPFDKESVDFLDSLPVPMYKIASFYLVNLNHLEYVASKGKPIIASRGMANKKEIQNAVDIFSKYNVDYALLHCVSSYPLKKEDANLNVIRSLKDNYNCVVGYSDHTLGIETAVYAVAVGANIIEKHFTLNKDQEGPDHKLSADPDELKEMISKIRELEKILGSNEIRLIEAEKGTIVYRKFT
jgi:N,N'-diacetyllegionaminate synthase